MLLEEIEFHDMPVSMIHLDFVDEILTLDIPPCGDGQQIPKKIIFKDIREIENTGFPSINSECEIYSLDVSVGNELKHLVKLVMLTGFGKRTWYYEFECSEIELL
ncbi:hypothetical protein [Flavobacterium sp.]|uniref:hypothetical protein n=1 Tax=Flavobacterium sp. TaxID=239 RepID=UPI004034A69F